MAERCISLRGVEVHNLQRVDVDLPHRKLIVLCGVSGSGKSSLAFDTLFAEGQRRYIESFSAYTRQFLERLEKPKAQRIDGIPPAVAVASRRAPRSNRSTVGTATEIHDYLRLLLARVGQVVCTRCGQNVRRESPQSAAENLSLNPAGTRILIAFPVQLSPEANQGEMAAALREEGFIRVIAGGVIWNLDQGPPPADSASDTAAAPLAPWYVVVDRLVLPSSPKRMHDSLETAFSKGDGQCFVFSEANAEGKTPLNPPFARGEDISLPLSKGEPEGVPRSLPLSKGESEGVCHEGLRLADPETPLNPSFARGEGTTLTFARGEGTALPLARGEEMFVYLDGRLWRLKRFSNRLACSGCGLEYPQPEPALFSFNHSLGACPECEGLGSISELETELAHVRAFRSRRRNYRTCPACGSARLRPEALATRLGNLNIAELTAMSVDGLLNFLRTVDLDTWQRSVGRVMLDQLSSRLTFLQGVGLAYLSLDRPLRTLSGGEAQRVALTSALGSSLVNMLYVLDEPSVGLHPHDTDRLLAAIVRLRDRGNTVVVVEHEEAMIRAADQVVEVGPGAGARGGKIVFQGTPAAMAECTTSLTGDYLSGRRSVRPSHQRRSTNQGRIRLAGARGNNLQNLTVDFPLGVLCVITGVSGAGKSTLIEETLVPVLCRRLRKPAPQPLAFDEVVGDGQIEHCVMVDQSPIGRSPRSNPVTYVKAFDEIRNAFASTVEARTRNLAAGRFSFNVEGGRCGKCEGDGQLRFDMQFLPDVYVKCDECQGKRFRPEILQITYRGRNIADVLEMTARDAFMFFRGQGKVQSRLRRLLDVGLDYLRLGQPANTLSGGESQRLKLASYLVRARCGRNLLVLDEPTTGLHFADIVQLLDCFEALLAAGNSLIVVEHNLHLIQAADYVIDLGPGAAEDGGRIVAVGTPEEVARNRESVTGQHLARLFAQAQGAPGAFHAAEA